MYIWAPFEPPANKISFLPSRWFCVPSFKLAPLLNLVQTFNFDTFSCREQYTHILQTIKETGPVNTAREGFDKVKEHLQGDFALINDAAQIRYEVFNDCDLLEIGEPFAEQPYALAVQQGSHLQEMLSR